MFTGVDARSAAVLIQAYTLGMIVDDIVPEQMTQENWNDLVHRLIQQVF